MSIITGYMEQMNDVSKGILCMMHYLGQMTD